MNEKDVVREAMKSCNWTQAVLAEKAGYSAQSSLSSRLNGKSMRVDTFVKLLSAMGYEVVVQSTSRNTNKNKWVVSNDEKVVNETVTDTSTSGGIDLDKLLGTVEQCSESPIKSTNGKIKLR